MKKILLALAGIVAAIGLTLTASVPAQAVTMDRSQHCNWPQKATVYPNNLQGTARFEAYSPSGWHLGTAYLTNGQRWYTPWEDITVFGYSSDGFWQVYGFCRLT